jgi:two-component system sensor histidine kinase EvgS
MYRSIIEGARFLRIIPLFFAFILVIILSHRCFALIPAQDFLTPEERQWLVDHPTLRLGVGIAFPPYQWVERTNDRFVFKGVVSEYVKILENRLNVKMEIVFGLKFQEALELGKKREIDLFPCLVQLPERLEFLLFTKPYISYPSVIITRDDAPFIGSLQDLQGRKVSLVKDQAIYSLLKKSYSHLNIQIIESEDAEQDLKTVSFGRADACLMDLGVASYLIQKLKIANLKFAAPSELKNVVLSMGVRNDWPILQSILEKTLQTINKDEKDAINQRWIQLKFDPGFPLSLVLRWAVGVGSIIFIIFTLLYFWNRSLRREIRVRQKIEEERVVLIADLQRALSEVKTLQSYLPICSHCRKVRKDSGYWQKIESYIQEHTDTKFSHGICPDCMRELYPDLAEKILQKYI